ncbi:MAG: helix-turn-helix domain-containing protein, partial [Methylococcaceae bacterium]|nr:helix-turn-helix domain-containing protein [Methylococcaceae bacterium]
FALPESGIDMESLEIDLINQALARTKGNRSKAARLLGLTRDTLLYRIHKYGIPV